MGVAILLLIGGHGACRPGRVRAPGRAGLNQCPPRTAIAIHQTIDLGGRIVRYLGQRRDV